MKDNDKITLTVGQIKKLITEGYDEDAPTSWFNHKSSSKMMKALDAVLNDSNMFDEVTRLPNGAIDVFDQEFGEWEIYIKPSRG